jgi:hypothetical protein
VLAALLLALLAWQSSAEFTHSHGFVTTQSSPAQQRPADPTQGTQPGFEGKTSNTPSRPRSAGDCLICQLHQNLSTTLFSDASIAGAMASLSLSAESAALLHRAEFYSITRGRAPPLFSLL